MLGAEIRWGRAPGYGEPGVYRIYLKPVDPEFDLELSGDQVDRFKEYWLHQVFFEDTLVHTGKGDFTTPRGWQADHIVEALLDFMADEFDTEDVPAWAALADNIRERRSEDHNDDFDYVSQVEILQSARPERGKNRAEFRGEVHGSHENEWYIKTMTHLLKGG